jgi:phenylalanyl-tRNA synthetase beta chain
MGAVRISFVNFDALLKKSCDKNMTISYNWLHEYLPVSIEPEKLSKILTAIGLEVESMEPYESVKGGMAGLVIGEVLTCEKHPGADKLSLTQVNIGSGEPLQIVCGAPNVAAGQKVVVATVGTTIYPVTGDPLTMKKAKIRGEDSFGMICAEDEIGLGKSHAGILVLPENLTPGTPAADYFKPYTDTLIEIGLTPNHMDAQSHIGAARDVTAWLNHHEKHGYSVKSPLGKAFKPAGNEPAIGVTIENPEACARYAGVSISGVTVGPSPAWMQNRLKAIGLRPINNIVDITNYILHETGQPLHAFDAATVEGARIIVKCLPAGTPFITLDEKERKLGGEDIMVCSATKPMCMGGVFGGLHSGVSESTTTIFLESAWFNPLSIRKTSLLHDLRTDAAVRFEKGVDISNTVNVLKRAALLIAELSGGHISSEVVDVYPQPAEKARVSVKYHYLKKLSGKNYHPETVKNIFTHLGFEIAKDAIDELTVMVPHHKTDISLPADLVEEIMRIDGLDNVEIPAAIMIAPSVEENPLREKLREKLSQALTGAGFNEIFTNSITNSAWLTDAEKKTAVKMINNLSAELDVLRVYMHGTGLQSIAYNLNRKNNHLRFFEFGKTYGTTGVGQYQEQEHLVLFTTGNKQEAGWNSKAAAGDIYYMKGVLEQLLNLCGLTFTAAPAEMPYLQPALEYSVNRKVVAFTGSIANDKLAQFDIKQPVFYADINWAVLLEAVMKNTVTYKEISKFPPVERDLAVLLDKAVTWQTIEAIVYNAKVGRLQQVKLFDIFENEEKLGAGKKSMALNLVFVDEEKTMTDKEIDGMMQNITEALEKEAGAQVRK